MTNYHIPLHPDKMYHVFNRAIGNEKLFLHDENYIFFLQKISKYILPIADIWAWCLLPNHYHIELRIKHEGIIKSHYSSIKKKEITEDANLPDFIMECFSNFQNSYAKAFNKVYKRKGGLFIDFMRRVEIIEDLQIGSTVFYIHKNPVHHGYCKEIKDWKFSSYKTFLSIATTNVSRNEVLNWFDGVDNFVKFHQQEIHLKNATVLE